MSVGKLKPEGLASEIRFCYFCIVIISIDIKLSRPAPLYIDIPLTIAKTRVDNI